MKTIYSVASLLLLSSASMATPVPTNNGAAAGGFEYQVDYGQENFKVNGEEFEFTIVGDDGGRPKGNSSEKNLAQR